MKLKKLFICLLLCAAGVGAFAQHGKAIDPVSKTISLSESFTSLTVENDFSVMLTESSSAEIRLEGDARDIKLTDAFVADGQLVLSFRKPNIKPDVTVYVPAGLLNKVNITGNATVRSSSVLQNKKLQILLAGEGKVNIKSTGTLTVEAESGIDFVKGR